MKIYDAFVHLERETPNDTLWQRALAEDSNRSLDWLWLATQVDGDKRRYCIRRARAIDPRAEELPEADTRRAGTLRRRLRITRSERARAGS